MEKSLDQIKSVLNGEVSPQYMLSVTRSQTLEELINASNNLIK
jgi:hypothetical protein